MPVIYRKTALGQQEIETRAGRIPPRLRPSLIMIDGKRAESELRKLIPQAEETLRVLLEAGMIEPLPVEARQPAATVTAPALAGGDSVPPTQPSPLDFQTWRREAVRAVNDLLGPAGESLAVRMERAPDERQLREVIERALPTIGNVRGGAAAAQFAKRFLPD